MVLLRANQDDDCRDDARRIEYETMAHLGRCLSKSWLYQYASELGELHSQFLSQGLNLEVQTADDHLAYY